ncbi:hypothetical protein PVAG01_02943 [Phlyctema vagabunda]|uniref:Inheritance of peroxisomes protein 1 n=1 Tax=Phlyctema vagabunda TaxID=108571 RepID=A0ABR4PS48_9HELO
MAYSGPSTPLPRRASLPVAPVSSPGQDQIETLYILPSARIISFTTPTTTLSPDAGTRSHAAEQETGNLPWSSRFERTVAIGPLRIYRAPGSVAFLSCNSALRPIMPKSQAWCVDEESSMFVLQVRRPQYWRIEIPKGTEEDKVRSDELKEVLGRVLLFEKTVCPFQRNFTVELPTVSELPIRKRPWKPVERASTASPERRFSEFGFDFHSRSESPLRSSSIPFTRPLSTIERSRPPKIDDSLQPNYKPCNSPGAGFDQDIEQIAPEVIPSIEQSPQASPLEQPIPELASIQEIKLGEDSDNFGQDTDDSSSTIRKDPNLPSNENALSYGQQDQNEAIKACDQSGAASPVRSLIIDVSPPHRSLSQIRRPSIGESESSEHSSGSSFYSTEDWHSPLDQSSPPTSPSTEETYPYPHHNITLQKPSQRSSDFTTEPESSRTWEVNGDDSAVGTESPSQPPTIISDDGEKLDEEQLEVMTPRNNVSTVRHRGTTSSNSRRRTLSPLPAAVNLFSPTTRRRPRHLQTARHLPTAIIQKTCEILLSPPSHLFHLMINIASKIAAGEWRGVLSGHGESVHWDFTEDQYSSDDWQEDDFGISLPGTFKKPQRRLLEPSNNPGSGGSWEVD